MMANDWNLQEMREDKIRRQTDQASMHHRHIHQKLLIWVPVVCAVIVFRFSISM